MVFTTAYIAIALTNHTERVAVIWIADAWWLWAIIRAPRRQWLSYLVVGLLATAVADVVTGTTPGFAVVLSSCNAVGVAFAATLMTRYVDTHNLSRGGELAKFAVIAGGAAPAASAILAALAFHVTGASSPTAVLKTWFFADSLGMVTVTPVLLMLRHTEVVQLFRPPRLKETLLFFAFVALAAGGVFGQTQYPFLFMMMPVMTLLGLRLGFGGAAIGVAIVAAVAVPLTVAGHGPLSLVPSANLAERIFLLQLFLAVEVFTILPLAAIFAARRRLEQEAISARQAAEQANAAKSTFLHTMSHELRTPMTGIMGMCHLLLAGEQTPGQRHVTQVLERSARSFLELLNDILDIAKIEAGHADIAATHFKISHVMRDVEDMYAPAMVQKGLAFTIDCTGGDGDAVIGDGRRLRQVLFNLVGNALKFTDRGSVRVRKRMTPRGDGTVDCEIEVTDTGIGMSPESMHRLFRAFEQADSSISRRYGGTGLGLYISKQLVGAMGGDIRAESELGHGARFTVRLQFVACAESDVPDRSTLAPAFNGAFLPGLKLDVLLAEDNPTIQMLVTQMLELSGHTVTLAENGRQAVERANDRRFDLILMDMQMPVMPGTEAVAAIRSGCGTSADTPIVALTADAILENRRLFLDAGCDAVVTKPIEWDTLAQTIRKLVGPVESMHDVASDNDAELLTFTLFDPRPIRDIQRDLGSTSTRGLLEECLKAMDRYQADIARFTAAGNSVEVKRAAHDLKSICAQFGAARASEIARRIEVEMTATNDVANVLPALAECVRQAVAQIRELEAQL
jgi:signal transduction histidine kinase/DNA-binding NarL/FixJ family response regulator